MSRITKGSVFQIKIENYYVYCQILGNASCVFFNYRDSNPLIEIAILNKQPVLFILSVYDDVIASGRWKRIGKLNIREEVVTLPNEFIQDPIDATKFSIYNPNSGEIRKSSREECIGLECAAVWEAEHVESRIKDFFDGKSNFWADQLSIK